MQHTTTSSFVERNNLSPLVPPDRSKTLLTLQDQTLKDLLDRKSVVTILIDGLGHDSTIHFAKEGGIRFLSWALQHKKISKNSAQWPSTTSVQITSLHCGMPIEEHGVVEWVMYEPKLGKLISPLPFSFAREKGTDTLLAYGLHPRDVFPSDSYYQRLRKHGIESAVVLPESLTHSGFNRLFSTDAQIIGFKDFAVGCSQCLASVTLSQAPKYTLLYVDDMDKISHEHTKDSTEFRIRLEQLFHAIENNVLRPLAASGKDVVVNITSDHGHHTIDPQAAVYLNRIIPRFDDYLQRSSSGEVIPCSGGYRSLFLHVKPERRTELHAILKEKLFSVAQVFTIEEMFERGYFNLAKCRDAFWSHVGNVIVLPYKGCSVGYYIPGVFEVKRRSLHGGASPEEMTTPLISFTIDEYRMHHV